MSLIVTALVATVGGAGVGLLTVAIFYRPDSLRGPTHRLAHLVWSGTLILTGVMFVAAALGVYREQGTPPDSEQRAINIGLALGYAVAGGWLALRRRQRAKRADIVLSIQEAAAAEGREVPSVTPRPTQPESRRRTTIRTAIRAVDYVLGVGLCGMALLGGYLATTWLKAWATRNGMHSTLLIGVAAQIAGFLYSLLVTSQAIRALNVAVRRDWRVRRSHQFLLAAGPFVFALQYSVASLGFGAGLVCQLVALYIGYRWTSGPPAGPLAILMQLRTERGWPPVGSAGGGLGR